MQIFLILIMIKKKTSIEINSNFYKNLETNIIQQIIKINK